MAGEESRANEVTIWSVVTSFVLGRSEGAYVAMIVLGVAGALGVWWFVPAYWRLAIPLAWIASLGGWGLSDRVAVDAAASAGETSGDARRWSLIRALARIVAVLATLALLLLLLRQVLDVG